MKNKSKNINKDRNNDRKMNRNKLRETRRGEYNRITKTVKIPMIKINTKRKKITIIISIIEIEI